MRGGLFGGLRGQPDGAAPLIGSSAGIRAVRERIERVAATDFAVLDRRGERLRKGTRGPADSRLERAPQRSVRRGQLRGDRRDAARGRAVRHRGAHRDRRARPARQVRARRTTARCSSTRSSDLSPAAQAKLLRAIQEMSIERVGGTGHAASTSASSRRRIRRSGGAGGAGAVPARPVLPA